MSSRPNPPKWPTRLLHWFCKDQLQESVFGDLEEQFEEDVKDRGLRKAKRRYAISVMRFCRPGVVKAFGGDYRMNYFGLFKNYLKVALRVLKREKSFTLVNITGLTMAVVCAVFIGLWVQDEFKYNSFVGDTDRICRILVNQTESSGVTSTSKVLPQPLKQVLDEKYPGIDKVALVNWNGSAFKKDESLIQLNGIYASPELFEIFEFPFVQGGHELMYDHLESIVISESFADQYFGSGWRNRSVVGAIIMTDKGEIYQTAGVIKDIPRHSTLRFDFLVPFEKRLKTNEWIRHWGNFTNSMYVRLADEISLEEVNNSIKTAIIDNRNQEMETAQICVQPFNDLYLKDQYSNGEIKGGKIRYVRVMSIAAILVLVIGCVNFINLSTSKANKRAKEIGVRKTLGAWRSSLTMQFLIESFLTVMTCIILASLVVYLLLPQFNDLTRKEIFIDPFDLGNLGRILIFGLILTFSSAIYPALYLSSFDPVKSLKSRVMIRGANIVVRKSLVTLQFAIASLMIISAIAVNSQVEFLLNQDLGFDKQNLVQVSMGDIDTEKNYGTFKNELLNKEGIIGIAPLHQDLINNTNSTSDPEWAGKGPSTRIEFSVLCTDPDLISISGISIKEGRNFSWELKSDTVNFIINEEAQKRMRLENPVGEDLVFWDTKGKIIGVVEDFNIHSLHSAIVPLILRYDPAMTHIMLIKLEEGKESPGLAAIEELFYQFNPGKTFKYKFIEDHHQKHYRSERVIGDISAIFMVAAIIISCIGLFALVSYTVEQRTKEIGVRKVLGASVENIFNLISKEFLILILIGFCFTAPLGYHLINGWLDNFSFRIDLNMWLFGLAFVTIIGVALVAIASRAWFASTANPVDSLRDE